MGTYHKALIFLLALCSCEDNVNIARTESDAIYDKQIDTVIPTTIYDGDTFGFLDEEHGFQRVRIIDVDAFETSVNDRIERQADRNNISIDSCLILGNKAKDFAFGNLYQKPIIIRKGSRNTDVYDRLLRYVEYDGKQYDSTLKALNLDSGL